MANMPKSKSEWLELVRSRPDGVLWESEFADDLWTRDVLSMLSGLLKDGSLVYLHLRPGTSGYGAYATPTPEHVEKSRRSEAAQHAYRSEQLERLIQARVSEVKE